MRRWCRVVPSTTVRHGNWLNRSQLRSLVIPSRRDHQELIQIVLDPMATYQTSVEGLDELMNRKISIKEMYFLAIMEKAIAENKYQHVPSHYEVFQKALDSQMISTRGNVHSMVRMRIHQQVLWALLHSVSPPNRHRALNGFYQTFIQRQPNVARFSEVFPLDYLIQMECLHHTIPSFIPLTSHQHWSKRIDTILNEFRHQGFEASHASTLAIVRFLLTKPSLALNDFSCTVKEQENKMIEKLVSFIHEDQGPISCSGRRISGMITTAASSSRWYVVMALLKEASVLNIPIDESTYDYITTVLTVTKTTDESIEWIETYENQIMMLYEQAKQDDRLFTESNSHYLHLDLNRLLSFAIQEGQFLHILELLYKMQMESIPIDRNICLSLFESLSDYRAALRQSSQASTLAIQLSKCPTLFDLLNNFPRVFIKKQRLISDAIIYSLKGGDLDVALQFLRTTLWSTDFQLEPLIYAEIMYGIYTIAKDKETLLNEVEAFYDRQHPDQRVMIYAQLLNMCQHNHDLLTMYAVLDRWSVQQSSIQRYLPRRALNRVLDTISFQLKTLQEESLEAKGQYKVQGRILSFVELMTTYRDLIPMNGWTLSQAIVRSKTSGLEHDVIYFVQQAEEQGIVLEQTAYKVAIQVIQEKQLVEACRVHMLDH